MVKEYIQKDLRIKGDKVINTECKDKYDMIYLKENQALSSQIRPMRCVVFCGKKLEWAYAGEEGYFSLFLAHLGVLACSKIQHYKQYPEYFSMLASRSWFKY